MTTTQIRKRKACLSTKTKLLLMVMLLPLSVMAQLITNYSPSNSAPGVSITDNLVFTFDASISLNDDSFSFISIRDADDVNIIYYSLDASNPGSAITTAGSTLTINPPGSLPYNKNITITIPGDVIYFGGSSYYSGLDFSNFGNYTFTTETAPSDNTAPTLSSLFPADNATNVAPHGNLFATLSEQVIGTTANINIRRMSNDAIIQSFPANEVVGNTGFSLNPSTDLAPNTEYYIEVPASAINDLSGNGFAGIAKPDWSFTTGNDTKAPLITEFYPLLNAIQNNLSANLVLTFDETVQKGSGNIVIYKRVASTNTALETISVTSPNVSISGNIVTVNPVSNLPENLSYVFVNIATTAFDDANGNSYAGINNISTWKFATGDPNPPVPTTFVPADNGTASTLSQNLSIVFDEDVQLGLGTIALYQSGGALVESFDAATSPRLSASGSALSIDPTTSLLEGTAYYITVDAGAIQDVFSNNYGGFSNNTTWNFTTADTSNPIVNSFNPTDNSTNVPTGSNLIITFNEDVQKGTGNILIRQSAGAAILETVDVTSGQVTISGSVVTINPSSILPSSAGIYVTIPSTAFDDIAGNSYVGISANSTWNFTTEAGGDVTPPLLSSKSPLDEATGVDVFTNLVLTFNEDVQAGSGSIIVRRYDNNAALKTIDITSGEVIFNNNQITIDLPGKLLLETQVYVQIINGAIQDLAGNNFIGTSSNEDWDFTTEAPSPPTVTSLSPVDGATGVAANAQTFTLTFNEDIFASTGFIRLKLATNNSTLESFSDADFTFNGNEVSFTSTTPMLYNTGYYITVQFGSFDDIKGSPFAGFNDNATWNFTTEPVPDLTAPSITTLSPADNATGIANNNWLFTATFNEDIQLGSGPVASRIISLVRSSDNGLMANAPSFDPLKTTISGNVVTVNFNGDGSLNAFSLDNNTGYHIEIGANCFEDLAGNDFAGIADNTTWNYTTDAGDVSAPLMTSLNPTDNATGISVTNWVYTINFNETIQAGSGTINLKKLSNDGLITNAAVGTPKVVITGNQVVIDFDNSGGMGSFEMDNSTEYYLEIPAGAFEDLAANPFAGIAKPNWSFTTETGGDVTPPLLTNLNPLDNAIDVGIDANFVATFNEPIQSTGTGQILLKNSNGTTKEGFNLPSAQVTFSGNTITINPINNMVNDAAYYITISNDAIEDIAGNGFSGISSNSIWNFTAEGINAPSILSLSPADDATGVLLSANLVLTADETIVQPASGNIIIKQGTTTVKTIAFNDGSVDFSGAVMTVTGALLALNNNTSYWVNVTGIEDLDGNPLPGTNALTWNFTTGSDITAPVITSMSPLQGAVDVAIDANFVLTFNEDVQLTGSGDFSIFNKATGVKIGPSFFFPAGATVSGNSVTYDRPVDMPYATEIYININNALEDLAGNNAVNINDNSTWVFTTEANPDVTPPSISSLLPVDNATNIPVNTWVYSLTLNEDVQVADGAAVISIKQSSNNNVFTTVPAAISSFITITNNVITIDFNGDGELNGLNLLYGTEYYIDIPNTAYEDLAGNEFAGTNSTDWSFITEKQDQTINFTALPDKTYGDADFDLTGTASSGLAVTYASSDESVATISGSMVTIVGVGSSIITASQGGNANYNAATNVPQTLTVNKANQTISFTSLANKTFGNTDFNLTATASSSLAVTYASADETVATISGSTVSIIGAGSTMITASQVGNENYIAATNVPQTLTVNKANQTISFTSLADKTFGDSGFNLTATASSGLAVSYASSDETLATISGSTISIIGAGSTMITASQVGDANFNAASDIIQNLTVNKSEQVISITGIADKVITDPDFDVIASTTSGLPLTYSVGGPATIIANTITLTGGSGTVNVTVDQVGNNNYNPAQSTTSFNVIDNSKQDQTISFDAITDKIFGASPFALSATASSGLTVSFEVVSGNVTLSGNMVSIIGVGAVVIKATQTGDASFNPAPIIEQSFTVAKAEQTITITSIADKLTTDLAFAVAASTTSGLGLDYSVTGPASIAGTTITLDGSEGTVTVTVSQAGDDDFNAANAETTFEVTTPAKADQTITITAIDDKLTTDASFDVVASTTSGLALDYSVTGPASIVGTTITLDGSEGTVTVTVSQVGDDDFNAASAETTFEVIAPGKEDQTITITAIDDKLTTDAAFDIVASTTSGLVLDYAVTGPATIAGTTITLDGTEGSVTVTVGQAGDDDFNAASVEITFEVTAPAKQDQTITFEPIDDQIIEAGSFLLEATASSGLDVTFEIISGPAGISDNEVDFLDFGSVIVRASQAGNEEFNPAPDIEHTFEIMTITGLEIDRKTAIEIYPNPTASFLNVAGDFDALQIVSTTGNVVYQTSATTDQIDLRFLIAGNYIIQISTKNGIESFRLLKK